jgi:predicted CXXCH cytochrome family protein
VPAHIVRLLGLLGAVLLVAVGARYYVLDPSYYQFGNYRGDSVVEATGETPKYRGAAYCQGCHSERHAEWTAGRHGGVQCEACHKAAGAHPGAGALERPENSIRLCTLCHEAMPGRPAAQPQIVVAEHPFKHEGDLQCTTCHNPHSPSAGAPAATGIAGADSDMTSAAVAENGAEPGRVAALTAACVPCHGADGRNTSLAAALAGSDRSTIVAKLQAYRSGELSNPMMKTIADSLSDEDIGELADYYAALPNAGSKP